MRLTLAFAAIGLALAASPATAADAARGERLYANWCGYCHDPVSDKQRQLAGTYTLEQRYKGARPAALVERTDLTPDYVKAIVRQGLNVMPRFRKTEVSDAELDDIAAFLTRQR